MNSHLQRDVPVNEVQVDPTIKQTEDRLQISRVTVYKLVREGKLQLYKIGRHSRIRWESIEHLREGVN